MSIINNDEPEPDFNDALEAQKIMEAAYVSAEQGKWIDLC
jgi:predicted dehydrogenase